MTAGELIPFLAMTTFSALLAFLIWRWIKVDQKMKD